MNTSDVPAAPPAMEHFSPSLALELSTGLLTAAEVFHNHGIEDEDAAKMLANPTFQNMVKQLKTEWESIDNTEKRARAKALLAVEEAIPSHYAMAVDPGVSPAGRDSALKTLKSIAGMDRAEAAGASGNQFQVNFNFSRDADMAVGGSINVIDNDAEDTSV